MDETETEELSKIDKHIIYSLFSGGQNLGTIIGKIVAVVGRGILWFPCYFLLPMSCFPVLRIPYSKQLNTHWSVNIISLFKKRLLIQIIHFCYCGNFYKWTWEKRKFSWFQESLYLALKCNLCFTSIYIPRSLTIKLPAPMRERLCNANVVTT